MEKYNNENNIEQTLETKMLLNMLGTIKENYKESITLKERDIKSNDKKNILITICCITLGLLVMIIDLFLNPFATLKIWLGIFSTLSSLGLLSPILVDNINKNKDLMKEINGINLANKKLYEKELEMKTLLGKLENKTVINEDITQISRNNYLYKLNELKKLLGLYCSIGANEEEFRKYYNCNVLDSKLSSEFTESDINEIKRYFKTK